jgi:hypothetical protein
MHVRIFRCDNTTQIPEEAVLKTQHLLALKQQYSELTGHWISSDAYAMIDTPSYELH